MTYQEFTKLMMPLAIQLGTEWDAPTWKLYHRAVEQIPLVLFAAAVQVAAETRTKMPSAGQMRELAEATRQSLLTANPYTGCIDCEQQRGWVTQIDTASGQPTVSRCPCKARYDEKLARMGVTSPIAAKALPAASSEFGRFGETDAA